ncbi:MAG: WG repeat-containing protein [Prevotella sp.]|nr:WG repeat-containing protein [Prevotella sp.]
MIPAQYDAVASSFQEGLAAVETGGKVGFIDLHNRFIIEPQYEPVKNLEGFSMGMAPVKVDGKYGYIDKKGRMAIEPQYDYAKGFKDNLLATVKNDGKFGAIDLAGDLVVACKYIAEEAMTTVPISNKDYREAAKNAKARNESKAYEALQKRLKQAENEAGERINNPAWIQPLTYETTSTDGNLQGIRDNYRRMVVPERFEEVSYDKANHVYIVKDQDSHYGVFSYKGDQLFRPLFDSIGGFSAGRSNVSIDDYSGWIENEGNMQEEFMDNICDAGLDFDQAGNSEKARELYERILLIDPNHVMALNNLAIMDINNKDYNKGMRKLKLAHKLAPDNKLVDENLHEAKQNRNERRWNRIGRAMDIVAAVAETAVAVMALADDSNDGLAEKNSENSHKGLTSLTTKDGVFDIDAEIRRLSYEVNEMKKGRFRGIGGKKYRQT